MNFLHRQLGNGLAVFVRLAEALNQHAFGLNELHHRLQTFPRAQVGHHERFQAVCVGAHADGVGLHY